MAEKVTTARKVGRSPGYPAIDLKLALEKAAAIYKAEAHHNAGFPTLMKHMGYRTVITLTNMMNRRSIITFDSATCGMNVEIDST